MNRDRLLDLLAAGLYLLLAVAVTWPLLATITTRVIGIPAGDTWDHLWTMHWARQAVTDPAVDLFVRPDAFAPEGLLLFPLNLLNELLSVPFQLVVGLTAAFNLMTLAQLVFAGWATFKLAGLYVGRSAAWVAGACFAFTPCMLSALINGSSEIANTGWVPFTLWILLRKTKRPFSLQGILLPALCIFLSALASWYYGAFCLMLVALLFVWTTATTPTPLRRNALLRLAAILGVSALLILPLALFFSHTLSHPDAAYFSQKGSYIRRAMNDPLYSASPLAFLMIRRDINPSGFLHAVFMGYTVVGLGLFGLFCGTIDRRTRVFWALVTIISAALALGPVLWINGREICHLPYYYAMRFLPFFHGLEFPYRFAIVTALGLSILAAIGLERLLRLRSSVLHGVAAALLIGLVLTESGFSIRWPLPLLDTAIPAPLCALADRADSGGVLELPIGFSFKGRYLYHQVGHRQAIPYGINRLIPDDLCAALGFDASEGLVGTAAIETLSAVQRQNLQQLGIRYLVWHRSADASHLHLRRSLKQAGVAIFHEDADLMVFDLGSGVTQREGEKLPAPEAPQRLEEA